MAVRKLKKSRQSVTGLFYSTSLRRLVQFDSILERDFILLLDMHPGIRRFDEQPIKIPYRDAEGLEQIYVPDFLIEFDADRFLGKGARQPWLVETKYRCELKANWPKLRPKLRAGVREAHRKNWRFHIVTESCLDTIPFANAKFLRRFIHADLPATAVDELITTARRMGKTTVSALLSHLRGNSQPEEMVQAVWCAIAKHLVVAEFDRPLGPESNVWSR